MEIYAGAEGNSHAEPPTSPRHGMAYRCVNMDPALILVVVQRQS